MRTLAILTILCAGCASDHGPTTLAEWAGPSPGFWRSETDEWIALAENGVVNVAVRLRCELPTTTGGICGLRDQVSDTFSIAYRGAMVSPDSAQGTLVSTAYLNAAYTASGSFGAKWTGGGWRVTAEARMTDGCRVSPATSVTFEAP